jgi:hypothetical protein
MGGRRSRRLGCDQPAFGQRGMQGRPINTAPVFHLRLGVHENIDWDPQRAKLPSEPDLLGVAILDEAQWVGGPGR